MSETKNISLNSIVLKYFNDLRDDDVARYMVEYEDVIYKLRDGEQITKLEAIIQLNMCPVFVREILGFEFVGNLNKYLIEKDITKGVKKMYDIISVGFLYYYHKNYPENILQSNASYYETGDGKNFSVELF